MSVIKVSNFFGLKLDAEQFSVDHYADLIGLKRKVEKDKYVQRLIKANGRKHLIVSIVKRQVLLKKIAHLLDDAIRKYDPAFYKKEVTTGTKEDRRYDAEEKLLWFAIIVAAGKTPKQLERANFKPDPESLRRLPKGKGLRFERVWEVLAENTADYIQKFKNGEVGVNPDLKEGGKESFWSKIFS